MKRRWLKTVLSLTLMVMLVPLMGSRCDDDYGFGGYFSDFGFDYVPSIGGFGFGGFEETYYEDSYYEDGGFYDPFFYDDSFYYEDDFYYDDFWKKKNTGRSGGR